MNIKWALRKYASVEIDLLLSHILGKPKEFLYLFPAHELTRIQTNKLARMVKRKMRGEPVAYILGYKNFMGLRFKVNKNVLIPRPETEWLMERVLSVIPSESSSRGIPYITKVKGSPPDFAATKSLRAGLHSPSDALRLGRDDKIRIKDDGLRILDLGTGSGCIAISLAKLLPSKIHNSKFIIHASDISTEALKVAKANAHYHKVKIKFIHSDILKNVRMSFDIIIANLPYVRAKDYRLRIKDLGHEPKKALTDGTNKWEIYERFFEQIPYHLNTNAIIYLEIDPPLKSRLSSWLKKYLPKARVKFHRDFNNLWRYAEIVL